MNGFTLWLLRVFYLGLGFFLTCKPNFTLIARNSKERPKKAFQVLYSRLVLSTLQLIEKLLQQISQLAFFFHAVKKFCNISESTYASYINRKKNKIVFVTILSRGTCFLRPVCESEIVFFPNLSLLSTEKTAKNFIPRLLTDLRKRRNPLQTLQNPYAQSYYLRQCPK